MLYLRATRESRSIDRFWPNKHSAMCTRIHIRKYTRVCTYTRGSVYAGALPSAYGYTRARGNHTARGGFHSFRYALELITGNAQFGSFFN
jgi:hypothetical protein